MKEILLRRILARIPSLPQSVGGRVAAAACGEEREGKLLVLACDAWDLSIGEVARRAGIPSTNLSSFVAGIAELSPPEREKLAAAIACTMAGDGH